MAVLAGCTSPIVPTDGGTDAFTAVPDAFTPTDSGANDDAGSDGGSTLVDAGTGDAGTTTGIAVVGTLGSLGGTVTAGTLRVVGGRLESVGRSCGGTICVTGALSP